LEKGACAVVLERRIHLPQGATWILVPNVRRTMGQWADAFFDRPSRRALLVGVTGTNGKTTVTYLLESIFFSARIPVGVIGTINYRYEDRLFPAPYTTPESIELQSLLRAMVDAGVQSVAMEVSSHALAMERVRGIEFDGAVFTNLTRDHLDFHADMEDYFLSKSRLFTDHLRESGKSRKFAIIHGGDPRGKELIRILSNHGIAVFSYGQDVEWDIHPLDCQADLDGLSGSIQVKNQTLHFTSRLIGSANLENILAAVGVGFATGMPLATIGAGIARLESVPGRLERISNSSGVTVLVDYAHTPDALERVLSALRPLTRGRILTVFGCGGDRDRGKRPLMGEIAARLSEVVIVTSDNPRTEEPSRIVDEIEAGILKKSEIEKLRPPVAGSDFYHSRANRFYLVEIDRRTAIRWALRLARPGDLLLIAGKGHENYQILGAHRIHFNDREVVAEELNLPAG
jgi:UDP-N-acetylmuramoyl-L-alanyl-D-glutamate--2,6-diaminopimelate ligase